MSLSDLASEAPSQLTLTGDDVVPVSADRAGRKRLDVPLLLQPAAVDPVVVELLGESRSLVFAGTSPARVTVDPRRYAAFDAWHPSEATPDRKRTAVLLAAAVACTLLLASMPPRRFAVWAIAAVAIVWAARLSIAIARQPTLFTRDEAGSRIIAATEGQTLRVPISDDQPWVPVVESIQQWRMLSPRIEAARDAATLELTLPAGGRIILVRQATRRERRA